jgi:hypothetical protein
MPRRNHTPTYRLHKQSGQAIVTLTDGLGGLRDFTLGEHNYPESHVEYARLVKEWGVNPRHLPYHCGACGQSMNGRIVASLQRSSDNAAISWCVCTCKKEEPAILVHKDGEVVRQLPEASEFTPGENWPADLEQLYDEATKAFAAGAYTACVMVCRKVLMVCACHEGATDGEPFVQYVKHITDTVLTFPKAKDSIDKIRMIGNEANHSVKFVTREEAKRAMSIVTYMLNTIYSLPAS